MPPTIAWYGGVAGRLELLDQTLLPASERVRRIETLAPLVDAIVRLAVRGAPALGVAAGYGVLLGVREREPRDGRAFAQALAVVGARLVAARPTAVNLGWAVARVQRRGE